MQRIKPGADLTKAGWSAPGKSPDWEKEKTRLSHLYELERDLWSIGCQGIAGIDEVGRGPLAGPVVAGAVILPGGVWLPGLNDSKQLSPGRRTDLAALIKERALAWAVAEVDVAYIDQYNIRQAALEAMRRCVRGLAVIPDYLLVDGMVIPQLKIPQAGLIRGDSRSASIAAASILAKVARDELMERLDTVYPGYGFIRHKGYGTPEHLAALRRLGPCPIHRYSFAPVRESTREVRA